MVKFLLIEAYDFESFPIGGSGSFSINIIKSFEGDIALVGISTQKTDIVGSWNKKTISGIEYDFFPTRYVKKRLNKKSLIPERIKWYLSLRKYKYKILNYNCSNVFIQSPDTLLAISNWDYENICYRFAGLTNPLKMSRYTWARPFYKLFEKLFLSKLNTINTILATASQMEIDRYSSIFKDNEIKKEMVQFPTRVDNSIFFQMNKRKELRDKWSFNNFNKIIITSGRLSGIKDWKLLIDSFKLFLNSFPNSLFLFVGNGEDKIYMEDYIEDSKLIANIKLLGFQEKVALAELLNLADLFVMGSYFEGWPTSMVEAIACGLPICSTNFGSALEIVNSNKLGKIVKDRSPDAFAKEMVNAISIEYDEAIYTHETDKYSVANLKADLLKYWHL